MRRVFLSRVRSRVLGVPQAPAVGIMAAQKESSAVNQIFPPSAAGNLISADRSPIGHESPGRVRRLKRAIKSRPKRSVGSGVGRRVCLNADTLRHSKQPGNDTNKSLANGRFQQLGLKGSSVEHTALKATHPHNPASACGRGGLLRCRFYRERFGHREGEFPVCEDVAARSLALPFFPEMTEDQVEKVARELGVARRAAKPRGRRSRARAAGQGGGLTGDRRADGHRSGPVGKGARGEVQGRSFRARHRADAGRDAALCRGESVGDTAASSARSRAGHRRPAAGTPNAGDRRAAVWSRSCPAAT